MPPRVKGSKITSKLDFVRVTYSAPMVASVLAALSASEQELLASPIENGWYPLALYEHVLMAICQVAAGGDPGIYARIGAYSADHQLGGTYRAFDAEEPLRVLGKMVPMHGLLNDPGEMEVLDLGQNHCLIVVRKPRGTPIVCQVARAFYRRTIERCQKSNVVVRERQCSGLLGRVCEFDVTWGDPDRG